MTSDGDGATGDPMEVARRIALRLLETRPRTEKELRDAMARKDVPQHVIDALVVRFREVRLLDDRALASALASTRTQVGLRGPARIRAELRSKGVAPDVVESAMSQVAADAELAAAREVARRRLRAGSGLETHVVRRRLTAALARRGFSSDVVRRVCDEALGAGGGHLDSGEC